MGTQMNEACIVGKTSGFVSVRDPYVEDLWVAANFKDLAAQGDMVGIARKSFGDFLQANHFLTDVLAEIAAFGGAATIDVIDCGVYQGMFSIASALVCDQLQAKARIGAYEANPILIEPLRRNFDLYGVDVTVHNLGIGGAAGTLEFAYPKGRMIGGSFLKSKRTGEFVSASCQVVPLSHILPDTDGIALVKLDIEGNEVDAFGSIRGSANRMGNVFIVEFAPWQGHKKIGGDLTYGAWLIENFFVYDLGSWAHVDQIRQVRDVAGLDGAIAGKARAFNTDLLLVPRGMVALAGAIAARG
jgi:FkbM family methyltransferase